MGIRLINEKELSEMTGLALQTLRNARMRRTGFPYIRLGGSIRGAIRYDLEDVERYIKHRRIEPQSNAE